MNVWELSDSCSLVHLNFSIVYTCTINLHNIEDDGHRGTYEEMVRITVFEWYLTGEQRTFACTPYHMCINPRAALSHRKWRPFLYWLDWWCSHTFRLSQNIYNTIIYELRLTFVDPPKYLWDNPIKNILRISYLKYNDYLKPYEVKLEAIFGWHSNSIYIYTTMLCANLTHFKYKQIFNFNDCDIFCKSQ